MRSRQGLTLLPLSLGVASCMLACAGTDRGARVPPAAKLRSRPAAEAATPATASSRSASSVAGPELAAATVQTAGCPAGMLAVVHEFCPKVARRCLEDEYDKANHITICRRFAPEMRCLEPRKQLRFCIDEFEFPNRRSAHPQVMLDWHEARSACAAQSKRLCSESEWTAACEGPDETPFPYGFERSQQSCNIDNPWIAPRLGRLYSTDPDVANAELSRLDQSAPSGSRPGCVSGFGVFDLTGNVDEWVLADRENPKKVARSSALKGGAWGHVRNACRPVTTSHAPEFRYYFVSFRCCRDIAAASE